MRRISIIGYYGTNIGDLIMLQSLIALMKKNNTILNVITYATPDEKDLLYLNLNHIEIYDISKSSFLKKLKSFLNAIKESDSIIWGGGTCFGEFAGNGGLKFMLLARLLNKKIYYANVGIGILNTIKNKLETKLAFSISSKIILRDKKSYDLALSLCPRQKQKIYLSYDLLYLYDKKIKLKDINSKYLLLAYRDLEKNSKDKQLNYLDATIKYCKQLCNKYKLNKIVIIDTDNEIDKISSLILYNKLKDSKLNIVYNHNSLSQKIQLISDASLVITGRLHVGFLAYIHEVPFTLFNYSPKNYSFLQEIDALDNLIEFESILDKNFLNIKKIELSDTLLSKKKSIKKYIIECIFKDKVYFENKN